MGDIIRMTNSTTGGPVFVYVKDGKILRITPIDFDETDAPSWTIEARGRTFAPPRKTTVAPYTAAFKSLIYSNKRILYPLKRVDFDPHGERNIQNRGVSGYERITWDEATDIVVSEINRIKREAGPSAILGEPSSHHLWGNIGYRHSAFFRFMNLVGFTYADHNPDSWEGWHWGGMHMWGFSWRLGIPEQYDLLEDALQHAEMIVFWSSDPETTSGIYSAFESTIRRRWLKDLGVKMVFIDPFFNHTAGLYADKWLAPKVGTDHALSFAIAYTWLTEGTYDKEYVATHTYGFDEWADYVLGKTDGLPKTPEWAEKESGVPACDIRALAREWAKRNTYLAAGGLGGWGGACRASHGIEWARGMIALATMQGMGKPGSNIWSTTQGVPLDFDFYFPGYTEGGISGDCDNTAAGYRFAWRMFDGKTTFPAPSNINTSAGQHIPRLRIPECIMEGKLTWSGKGFCGGDTGHQMHQYTYPAPGYSRIKMLWKYGGPHLGTMPASNRFAKMYHDPSLEFVVSQSIWFEGETPFADIILPACTNFERWDISEFANCSGYIPHTFQQCNHRVITLQMKCIEPLGESKSDYDIFALVAHRLGIGDIYTEGKTDLDWVKQYYYATDMPKYMTFEEFMKKGYFVVPVRPERKRTPALRWFAEDREKDTPDWGPRPNNQIAGKGLATTTGKVEFVSTSLKRFEEQGFVDEYRPAMHTYVPAWEGPRSELAREYPLGLVSPHPRFSFHTMGDGKDSFILDIKDHRVLIDGHYYWIIRMNPKDAAARGIADGDLVRVYNDRGSVIVCARLTERVPPGVVHSYESSAEYQPLGAPGRSTDRGGCMNILTPERFLSKYACGMAPNAAQVEVEKWKPEPQEAEAGTAAGHKERLA
ncbi:MAG: molybdopterin-dependent oxidoreductase [Thermoleophilia bacterium]|nr:molybdopterin-dependent oxidoreductase [Thermoleophilia bacterium]